MDFVTENNVVINHENVSSNQAALLAYDTLIAAEKTKRRKEDKKHA